MGTGWELTFTNDKLRRRIDQLQAFRYRDVQSIEPWSFGLDEAGAVGTRPPADGEMKPVHLGDGWSGRDLYAWLSSTVTIPREWADKTIVGIFDFGKTGGGGTSGFESLLYCNGAPFQGVDSNHNEVFLPNETPGQSLDLTFRLWSGLEGGGRPTVQEFRLSQADVAWLDERVDDLYYSARAMLETFNALGEANPDALSIMDALDRAFRQIDWSQPGSESFYQSAYRAQEILNHEVETFDKHSSITVYAVGHTHIDVAWLWRLKHTREKAARSFATVFRMMERFPEYQFLQSQPQLYDYLKTDYPDLYEQLVERVRDGRWEPEGAMWLEADTNLPSGESLVRQILFGTRFFAKEFGTTCHYLWLPDVFGYTWALPQILKNAGIETFSTTKISWNEFNRMPHDTFLWRGMDGSEVLTHFLTTPDKRHWDNPDVWFATYNGELMAGTVLGTWRAYQDKSLNRDLLVAYGYGDGGGGVNREMLEMRRRLDRLPGLPYVKTGRADEYFDQLHRNLEEQGKPIPVWDGELYLELHRGTYTSQAYQKRMNRKLELAYRDGEWLNVVASLITGSSADGNHQRLNQGWKIILRNQFHDIIPGSSIHEVYEDSRVEYQEALELVEGVWKDSAARLFGASAPTTEFRVLNSATWERSAVVPLPVKALSGRFLDRDGKVLDAERVDDQHWLVLSPEVPGLGWTTVRFDPESPGASDTSPSDFFQVSQHGVVTPDYQLEWDATGQWTRLFDRRLEREVLAEGEHGNVFEVFEDKPINSDAWDIDVYYQEKRRLVDDLESVETLNVGPIAAVVRFTWKYDHSRIVQDLTFYRHSPRIDAVTEVDWHEQQQLLKVAFPVAIRATRATYDIQFGNIERPTHSNTSWDEAKFEVVGHQWADLSETGYGLSLASDCKYGYSIKDHTMRLSLIKSAINPDYLADQGKHLFTYALLPHAGTWMEANTVAQAWDLNSPLRAEAATAGPETFQLLKTSAAHVQIDAVKRAEDSPRTVVRLHEFTGQRGTVQCDSDLEIQSWQCCNVLESPIGEVYSGPIEFSIAPYEIKTLLIEWKA